MTSNNVCRYIGNLSTRGLRTCCVTGDQEDNCVKESVMKGEYQLVLFTPEMLIDKKQWRWMLLPRARIVRLRQTILNGIVNG